MPTYDAFISYSHVDGVVARSVHRGLHRIARRPGQLRALHVFRDSTDLSASPDLWATVVQAMEASRYLVLILSPTAAASKWVGREVDHWVSNHSTDHLLLVLAGGDLAWDEERHCFDPAASSAALPRLTEPGIFSREPLYIDLREAGSSDLDSMFLRERITELAAPIHGKSKGELFSEDARELRRSRTLRRGAVIGLATLSLCLAGVAIVAVRAQRRATHERDLAVARILLQDSQSTGDSDAGLSKLESVAAWRIAPSQATYSAMLDAVRRPGLAALAGHSGTVRGVDVDPTGRTLASVGSDGTLRLWDVRRRRQQAVLEDSEDGLNAVAFSPSGTTVAAGGSDGRVRIFDVDTGKESGSFMPSRGADRVTGVAFDPVRNEVVAVALDGSLTWWSPKTHQIMHSQQLGGDLWSLAYSPDGASLAVTGEDSGAIRLLLRSGRQRVLQPPSGSPGTPAANGVHSVAFSTDSRLVAATTPGKVEIFRTSNGHHLGDLRVNAASAAFTPDGNHVLTGNMSGTIWAWRLRDEAEVCDLTGSTGPVLGVTVLPNGRTLASAGADGMVRLWNLDPCLPVHRLAGGAEDIDATAAWSPDGRQLVTLASGALRLWNPTTGRLVRSLPSPRPDHLVFDPDGEHVLVTGAGDGDRAGVRVARVDVRTGTTRTVADLPDASVDSLAMAPDGRTLAVAAYGSSRQSRNVHLIAMQGGGSPRPLDANPVAETPAIAYSPDGRRLLAGGSDSSIELWDPRSGRRVARVVTSKESAKAVDTANAVRTVAFSPDGRVAATGGDDRRIRLWSVAGGHLRLRVTFDPASSTIRSLSFAPGGHLIASGERDGVAQLWDTTTGHPVGAPMLGHQDAASLYSNGVGRVAFSTDTPWLATTGEDGYTDLWRTQSSSVPLAETLCRDAGTDLEPGQWRRVTGADSTFKKTCPSRSTGAG